MPGWESAVAALASATRRCRAASSWSRCGWSSLTATSLSSCTSRARQPLAVPPAAISRSRRYRPIARVLTVIRVLPQAPAARFVLGEEILLPGHDQRSRTRVVFGTSVVIAANQYDRQLFNLAAGQVGGRGQLIGHGND